MWISTFSFVSILLLPLFTCAASLNQTEFVDLRPVQHLLQFVDQRLATVYLVIQKFKSIITLDPLGITASWVTSDVCRYRGFYSYNPPDNFSAIAVASIDFNGFSLAAPTLGGFLDMLPDLTLFHANSNEFGGTVLSTAAPSP